MFLKQRKTTYLVVYKYIIMLNTLNQKHHSCDSPIPMEGKSCSLSLP